MKCDLSASISPTIAPAAPLAPLTLGAIAIAIAIASALATQRLLLHAPARRWGCAASEAAR